jgi:peroxiredoxin
MLALVPLLGQAQSTDYSLKVKLHALAASSKAYLVTGFGWSDQRVIDSAAAKNGTFLFKGTAVEPLKTQLVIDHTGQGLASLGRLRNADFLIVYLEQGEILITGDDSVKHATITGSALNTEYAKYRAVVLSVTEKASNEIDVEYLAASIEKRSDTSFRADLMAKMKKAIGERDSLKYVYVRQNPGSFLSLEALRELAGKDIDVAKIEPIFSGLSPGLRKSKAGTDFAKLLYDDGPTAIGAMAPDFVENDMDDHPVKLSDFKGKYVLLDFWASWCGPCRAENPNVVKAFNKYKDKGFTVLGVSLDQPGKKDAWLAAIKKDGLSWTQVSDLKFWNNAVAKLYGIMAIPQNFLIDPKGKIVGKNLRGEALEKKLEEVL